VTALYVAFNAVVLHAVPMAELAGKKEFGHAAAVVMFGPHVAAGLTVVICLVVAASVSALVMTGPRVYTVMAEDGLFFQLFARRNARGAPAWGVLFQGALAVVLAMWANLDWLFTYIGFTLSLCAAATVLGAFVLRWRAPGAPRPYRTPLWPITPILFFGLSLWMAAYSIAQKPLATLTGAATIALGTVFYWVWRR
jgi:APA family basic amino acid/polyamine antiporter